MIRSDEFKRVWNGSLSIPEVAVRLGMSEGTVRTRANWLRKVKGVKLKCMCCHCPEKKT